MTNLQLLIQQYGSVTLDMHQLAEVLHMTPKTTAEQAAAGKLPFKTFKAGRKRLVTIYSVAQFLDNQGTQ
jgi:hypothetical protein